MQQKRLVWMKGVSRVLLLVLLSVWVPARADWVASEQIVHPESAPAALQERQAVAAFLARQEVAAHLRQWGVSPERATARVAALSDAEVHQVYTHVQSVPAGGMDIIGTLVFIFVLLLITDILGFTKVFPFTRSIRR